MRGPTSRNRLDSLETAARNLAELAGSEVGHFGLDQFDRDELQGLAQLVEAIDTWSTWAHGQPVPTAELAQAVSLLHDTARHAPPLRTRAGEIDQTQWFDLLEPVTALLERHGLPIRDCIGHDFERASPDLGIDL